MSQAPPPLLRMETYQDDQLPSFSKDDLSPSSLRLRSGPSTPSSETQLSVRHHDHQDQTDPVEGPRRRTGRRRQLFRKVRRHVRRRLGGKESALLILYSLGFLVSSCGNSIFFKYDSRLFLHRKLFQENDECHAKLRVVYYTNSMFSLRAHIRSCCDGCFFTR